MKNNPESKKDTTKPNSSENEANARLIKISLDFSAEQIDAQKKLKLNISKPQTLTQKR